jgi:hypothetical protein
LQRLGDAAGRKRRSTRFDSRRIPFVASEESKRFDDRSGGMIESRTTSSVIRGAWYLPERQQLDLLFTSGRRYIYSDVPASVAGRFAEAESKGRFYNLEIRNRFPCREVGSAARDRSAA